MKAMRIVLVLIGLSAVTWPPAWAAPATDNLVVVVGAPITTRCEDDPEGGDGYITCQTDNATVTFYMDSNGEYELETPDRQDVTWAIDYQYRPTHLVMVEDNSPTFSGSAETDIIYQEGSDHVDDDLQGVTWCNNAVVSNGTGWKCDQQYIRIRGNGVYSTRIVCHETGHAIGFVHGNRANPTLSQGDDRLGCMTNPVETASLGSSNEQNINAEWDAP